MLVSKEIAHLSTMNAQNIFQTIRNLARIYPAMAEERGETLPYVTFDNFESIAGGARRLAKAESILYMPLLKTAEEIASWEEYSKNRSAWLRRGRTFENVDGSKYSGEQNVTSDEISPKIFRFAGPPPFKRIPVSADEGVASPLWQM